MMHPYRCWADDPDENESDVTTIEAQSPGDAAEEFCRLEGEEDDGRTITVYVLDSMSSRWKFRVTVHATVTYTAQRVV